MTRELERRRAKMQQIFVAMDADLEFVKDRDVTYGHRDARIPEALELLERLREDRDLEAFRVGMEEWSRRPGFESFGGFNGQMFLNQLVKRSGGDEDAVASLLVETLAAPSSESEAEQRLASFTQHVETVRKGAHPAPGRVAFFVSFFWALADEEAWPAMWNSAEEMLKALGWLTSDWHPPDRYLSFRKSYQAVATDGSRRAESALYWLDQNRFAGLDPSLLERCAENASLLEQWTEADGYGREDLEAQAETNARCALGDLRLLGQALADQIGTVLGRSVRLPSVQTRTAMDSKAPFRADAYATWVLEFEGDITAPAFRVWATRSGIAVGLHAGYAGSGWHREVAGLASEALPEEIEFIEIRGHATGDRLRPAAKTFPGNETFIGRWFPSGDALDRLDFSDDVLETVGDLKDVVGMIVQRLGTDEKEASEAVPGSELADEVEAFKRSRPYPQEKDRWHHGQRDEMAARLTPESLQDLDLDTFRLLINGKRYGNPGPQSRLNTFLGEAGPEDLSRLTHAVRYLLWGEDNDPTRIDRVLDQDDLGVYGLGESVVMKLLSVARPERYVPVFPYTGAMGKLAMLDLLGIERSDVADGSRGSRQVAANDALRRVLEPHFDDDAWGMGQFLYWKRAQDEAAPRGSEDVLGRLADEVLLDESFLQEVVSLLRDRGQVVFYGPPGTGKTFLARRLAEMLAPDATRRSIVQFHPSTSYEDFVEGFRPDSAGDALTYRLVKGPLARLAEAAEEAPGVDHVLVIDELNRANLPRVFGELLYLLEYRDEGVNPLYRPDELFVLPKNVLVIGTMNTADRSIALVDVALRRRFHFVPFLPDSGPLTGLLERWLDRHGEPGWVADLVAMVNDELEERLGGPHLKLGPSYFMENNLDEDRLRRIWTYDIYPRIEEHLYGEWDELKRYSWSQVLRRFRSEQPVVADESDLPDDSAPDEVEP